MMAANLIVDFPRSNELYQQDQDHQGCPGCHLPDHETESDLPTKDRPEVHFSSTSTLYSYAIDQECPDDGSSSSRSHSWYTASEEQDFKYQANQEVMLFRHIKAGNLDASKLPQELQNNICPFGLEQKLISTDYTKKRIITKRLVALSVLTEQSRVVSEQESEDDRWERIARASRQHSAWSRTQSQTIGIIQSA